MAMAAWAASSSIISRSSSLTARSAGLRVSAIPADDNREALAPGAAAPPRVPALDLDPGAHAVALPVAVGRAGVVRRDPVDVRQVRVFLDRGDAPAERDVVVPRGLVEDGQRHAPVAAEVVQAGAAPLPGLADPGGPPTP